MSDTIATFTMPTPVVSVPFALRAAGDHLFTCNVPVPNGLRFARLTILLQDADKLADGKVLSWQFAFSSDGGATWQFENGSTWTSYGPGGLIVTDPDGTVHVNADPTLYCPLDTRAGQLVQATLTLGQDLQAGALIEIK